MRTKGLRHFGERGRKVSKDKKLKIGLPSARAAYIRSMRVKEVMKSDDTGTEVVKRAGAALANLIIHLITRMFRAILSLLMKILALILPYLLIAMIPVMVIIIAVAAVGAAMGEVEEAAAIASITPVPVATGDAVFAGSMYWPVPGNYYITSNAAYRINPITGVPETHGAMDIGCPTGTPVHAAMEGTVIVSEFNASAGNYIILQHENGLYTTYMHNSELLVSVGEKVSAAQVIAYSGSTGNSTGPHCHFQVNQGTYDHSTRIDPCPFFGLPDYFVGDATAYIVKEDD